MSNNKQVALQKQIAYIKNKQLWISIQLKQS